MLIVMGGLKHTNPACDRVPLDHFLMQCNLPETRYDSNRLNIYPNIY